MEKTTEVTTPFRLNGHRAFSQILREWGAYFADSGYRGEALRELKLSALSAITHRATRVYALQQPSSWAVVRQPAQGPMVVFGHSEDALALLEAVTLGRPYVTCRESWPRTEQARYNPAPLWRAYDGVTLLTRTQKFLAADSRLFNVE